MPRKGTTQLGSDAVLERLTRLHPKLIDLSLVRVERLLGLLGNPEDKLAPVVHVAGTNAKGSVIAFLRAMLEAAGYRVHVHTSPHLVRFNERIRLAGDLIAEGALTELLEECETANAGAPITFFEITTVAALLAFSRAEADVVLLETGLGGRLDATNVVARPGLCVLTPVSLDHQQFLGDDLESIAREKAGILKPGVACVSAAQDPAAAKAIAARAAGIGAPVFWEGESWSVRAGGEGLVFEDAEGKRTLPLPALPGPFQIHNAGLAIACAGRLDGFALPSCAIARGLREVDWPGRLQRLDAGPLASALPGGWELWVDGGHNGAAGLALAGQAEIWRDKPLYLVCGMLDSKDPEAFLAPLAPYVDRLAGVAIPGENASLGAEQMVQAARGVGMAADGAESPVEAMRGLAGADGPARVLVCGSLYLAGAVIGEAAC